MLSVDFYAYSDRNDLHLASSKLRYSKYVKKCKPCRLDSFCPEFAFYYIYEQGQIPDSLIEIGYSKIYKTKKLVKKRNCRGYRKDTNNRNS